MTSLEERFRTWHNKNPHVFMLFERFALQVAKAGYKRSSAWLIINRIRWETSIVTQGGDFKIPNDFIALYSRMFMERHPEYEGFFAKRRMTRAKNEI